MRMPKIHTKTLWLAGLTSLSLAACGEGQSDDTPAPEGSSGTGSGAAGTGAAGTGATAGQSGAAGSGGSGTSGGSGGSGTSGAAGNLGKAGTSGAGASGVSGMGSGAAAGTSGAAGSAGASGGGSAGTNSAGGGCAMGAWPATDPAAAGPFETVTEENVGPAAGEGEDGGEPVPFTLFRPANLDESGLCHPVVTWGNGTGSTPNLYGVLLRHLASHGFVVIASNSKNVGRGDPPPMVAGVSWVIAQNEDPASSLYRRIDTAHVGATGHSQGGFATTTAAGDSQITTMAPLCGASQQRNLHGPAFLFCGGEDTTVECDGIRRTFDGISTQPAMFANYLTADHANWITFRGTTLTPVEVAVTAWMRVQLMNDTALRSWFYGPSCALCTDAAWEVVQKDMDQ